MLQDHLPNLTVDVASAQIVSGATIYRDRWSIPHIYAENAHDAFFAQGYATAQDRLWQMDFDRLRCLGRAAEYLGNSAIIEDTLMRRRDFETISLADYDLCSTEAKTALDAYTHGVNAFINSDNPLPYEYQLLDTEPELWQPWHCIVVYKVRNSAEGSFQSKLWRAKLAAEIGPENAAKLSPGYQQGMYLTVPPSVVYDGPAENAVDELRAAVNATAPLREIDGGSNGWAVSGDLTASGIPMVGGDSHRGLEVPNVYYQVHMRSDEFDVLGHSVPGMPMVMHFAHNRHVAWGMTHGGVDTQDLFVEQLRRTDQSAQYLFKGEWLPAEFSREQLNVRGDEPQTIEVVKTHHGPIISGSPDDGWGIALADPGSNDATPWIDATLDAMKCKNADEFEQALSRWTDRVNNYPYADIHGNFGYALKGRIPIRNAVNGWGPVEGWTGENEWQGYIPDDELPRSRNPETGWVVTCNQRVVGEDYPYFLKRHVRFRLPCPPHYLAHRRSQGKWASPTCRRHGSISRRCENRSRNEAVDAAAEFGHRRVAGRCIQSRLENSARMERQPRRRLRRRSHLQRLQRRNLARPDATKLRHRSRSIRRKSRPKRRRPPTPTTQTRFHQRYPERQRKRIPRRQRIRRVLPVNHPDQRRQKTRARLRIN